QCKASGDEVARQRPFLAKNAKEPQRNAKNKRSGRAGRFVLGSIGIILGSIGFRPGLHWVQIRFRFRARWLIFNDMPGSFAVFIFLPCFADGEQTTKRAGELAVVGGLAPIEEIEGVGAVAEGGEGLGGARAGLVTT